ncbi:hypothetical protein BJM06_01397 [Enterobacter cloacae]|nr:hypothetical protein BJM06_01397 [Enterobacter cloacae]
MGEQPHNKNNSDNTYFIIFILLIYPAFLPCFTSQSHSRSINTGTCPHRFCRRIWIIYINNVSIRKMPK